MENVTQVTQSSQGSPESYFDGGVFQWLGWKILGWLVTGLTLGICYPFAVNWMYSWVAKHTVIDGRRLKFTGSAGGLFGTWMLCLLLCLVTLGIYSFWVLLKIRKWREANTFFEDEVPTFDAEQRLRREKASRFDGGLMQYIGWNILGALVTFLTLGICYPWAVQMVYSWEQRHKVCCNRRCTFDGRAVGLFGTWMLCLLLCLVTFGIYSFWVPLRIQKWKVMHTHLLADDTPVEEQESKGLTPEELAEKERQKERQKEKLAVWLSAAGPVLTVAGIAIQILYFRFKEHLRSWGYCFYLLRFHELWILCPLLLCAVGLLVLSMVRFKNRSVVQLGLITATLLLVSFFYESFRKVYRKDIGLLLSLAGVVVSFVGWYKGLATEELTERQRKERAAAWLSVAGPVLTVVCTVGLVLYLPVGHIISRSYISQSGWYLYPLLLCAVGLLVLSMVRFKNRSVVQLILVIAALVFASVGFAWAEYTVGLVRSLALAGVVVSFIGWYKGLATEGLTERQRKERAAAQLSVAGPVLTVVGTVRYIIPLFRDFRYYIGSYSWMRIICLVLLCAVGLLVLSMVRFKNRSVVQLILMIAALLLSLLYLLQYDYCRRLLRDFVYYLRHGIFLYAVNNCLLMLLILLLPFAGVVVSFVGWFKERKAAAEAAEDSAGE